MKPAQADAARALFATVLNEQGLKLLDGVRLLEGVLREQQGSWRDPGRYYLSAAHPAPGRARTRPAGRIRVDRFRDRRPGRV
jgi:hypothetical protein